MALLTGNLALHELAAEVQRQNENKKDLVAPQARLGVDVMADDSQQLYVEGHGHYPMRDTFHRQLSQRLGIPWKYYERCLEQQTNPYLLPEHVNHWIREEPGKKRFVRILDGEARAFLSNRYRAMDNYDLLANTMAAMQEHGARVQSCGLDDRRMTLKITSEKLQADVREGDPVQLGVLLRNSEIGFGRLRVIPYLYRLICTNGMVSAVQIGEGLQRSHLGSQLGKLGDVAEEWERDDTRQAADELLWRQVRDTIDGILQPETLVRITEDLRRAAGEIIPREAKVAEVTERTATRFGLSASEQAGVMESLIRAGDYTQWGLANAITEQAHDSETFERAHELQIAGGLLVASTPRQWAELVAA